VAISADLEDLAAAALAAAVPEEAGNSVKYLFNASNLDSSQSTFFYLSRLSQAVRLETVGFFLVPLWEG
jgi:hypothetical protein